MKPLYRLFAAISMGIAAMLFVVGGLWFAVAGIFAHFAKWWLEDSGNTRG